MPTRPSTERRRQVRSALINLGAWRRQQVLGSRFDAPASRTSSFLFLPPVPPLLLSPPPPRSFYFRLYARADSALARATRSVTLRGPFGRVKGATRIDFLGTSGSSRRPLRKNNNSLKAKAVFTFIITRV